MPTIQPNAGQKESSFGQTMREHRIAKGWTSKRLADETGISVGHCVKLERGERRWSVETIDAAAKAFGITRSEMLGVPDILSRPHIRRRPPRTRSPWPSRTVSDQSRKGDGCGAFWEQPSPGQH